MRFAAPLGLLDDDEQQFIRNLSEIRNDFVHDVGKVGTSLMAYVGALDSGKFDALRRAIGPGGEVTLKSPACAQ